MLITIHSRRSVNSLRIISSKLSKRHSRNLRLRKVISLIENQKINLRQTTTSISRTSRKRHRRTIMQLNSAPPLRTRLTRHMTLQRLTAIHHRPRTLPNILRSFPLLRRENNRMPQNKQPIQDNHRQNQRLAILARTQQHSIRMNPTPLIIGSANTAHHLRLPRHRPSTRTLSKRQRLITMRIITRRR